MTERRDTLGRRIGRNWWREMNCTMLLDATISWERDCEEAALGYATETAEFKALNPMPQLKLFLVGNKNMHRDPSTL